MRFSLRSFVRLCDARALEAYCAERGVAEGNDWSDGDAARAGLLEAIEKLDGGEREQILCEFEQANELRGEFPQRALFAVLRDQATIDALAALDSDQGRALDLLRRDRAAFDAAMATHQAESLRKQATWSAFRLGAKLDPRPVAKSALDEIQAAFAKSHHARGGVVVERFDRRSVAPSGALDLGAGEVVQWSIFAKNNPRTETVFEGQEVVARVLHPAIEAAVTYEPATGALDALSSGGKKTQEALARAIATNVLGWNDEVRPVEPRLHALDGLRRAMPFPTDPEDEIERVAVTKLVLRHRRLLDTKLTIDHPRDGPDAIWPRCHDLFGARDPLTAPEWWIAEAELRVVFRPPPNKKRGEILAVRIRRPNGCSLKSQTERQRLIGEKYLERWGLVKPLDD